MKDAGDDVPNGPTAFDKMVKKLKLKKADWPKSEKLSYTPIDPFVALVVPEPDFTICKHLLLHGRHDLRNVF